MGKDIQSILFKDVKFPENYWFEDTVIGSVTHVRAKSMANISQSVYRYLINPQGITSRAYGVPKELDSVYITLQLLKDRRILGLNDDAKFYSAILYQIKMNLWRAWSLHNRKIDKALFVILTDIISKFNSFDTDDSTLELLEWSLRKKSFSNYLIGCLHE